MITHKVIDESITEDDMFYNNISNVIFAGSFAECNNIINESTSEMLKIVGLTKDEIQFYNSYDAALKQGNKYLKTGNLKSFK